MTERDKSRYTKWSVVIGEGVQVLVWIRRDGSVEPSGGLITWTDLMMEPEGSDDGAEGAYLPAPSSALVLTSTP
ncbi:hypothetical protein EVAR_93577_1 [Eumeta japonica]|uniref:Uncharacterized protein n=1 Tax=Eumeta variegata TaxID=151549 RepID=A0A4C1USH3_EUMVA|nr:hypothetical protein EVAR_93577_1 [Eumeta japonica]